MRRELGRDVVVSGWWSHLNNFITAASPSSFSFFSSSSISLLSLSQSTFFFEAQGTPGLFYACEGRVVARAVVERAQVTLRGDHDRHHMNLLTHAAHTTNPLQDTFVVGTQRKGAALTWHRRWGPGPGQRRWAWAGAEGRAGRAGRPGRRARPTFPAPPSST